MLYLQLFFSFLKIGLFSFGGGYATLPLIQNEIINKYHWFSMSELTDLVTISQMTPGPIAINGATFVGMKIAGLPGAIVATIGCILPSCIIVTALAYLYLKYRKLSVMQDILSMLRPAIIGLIAIAGAEIIMNAFFGGSQILWKDLKIDMVVLFFFSLYVLKNKEVSPIAVMVMCGLLKVGFSFILG